MDVGVLDQSTPAGRTYLVQAKAIFQAYTFPLKKAKPAGKQTFFLLIIIYCSTVLYMRYLLF